MPGGNILPRIINLDGVGNLMEKWVVRYSPVYKFPGREWLIDLPMGTLVKTTGKTQDLIYRNVPTVWEEIIITFAPRTWQGWIYSAFLEAYVEEYPSAVEIEHPTVNPQDAAQYTTWRGQIQYNLCGELCVAYIVEKSIETLLTEWEAKAPAAYKSVFVNGAARTTGIYDLESILKIYGYPVPLQTYAEGLRDPVIAQTLITPGRLAKKLKTHYAIVGVSIDAATGNLKTFGTAHWVVVERCIPDGDNHGWVELYNPFPNRTQIYSWMEFTSSAMLRGAWIQRKI
jgi:hypothetical protein